jgi:metal-responsive CopG/Arc/MetJ family transcriptional regulator
MAKHRRVNRSALVREALKAHLQRLATREREDRDREGYASRPFDDEESIGWHKVGAWPDE